MAVSGSRWYRVWVSSTIPYKLQYYIDAISMLPSGDWTLLPVCLSFVMPAISTPPVSCHNIWNHTQCVTAAAASQRLSQWTVWCNRQRCTQMDSTLQAFLICTDLEFLVDADVITDTKMLDEDGTRNQNSGIHTSLLNIHLWRRCNEARYFDNITDGKIMQACISDLSCY